MQQDTQKGFRKSRIGERWLNVHMIMSVPQKITARPHLHKILQSLWHQVLGILFIFGCYGNSFMMKFAIYIACENSRPSSLPAPSGWLFSQATIYTLKERLGGETS